MCIVQALPGVQLSAHDFKHSLAGAETQTRVHGAKHTSSCCPARTHPCRVERACARGRIHQQLQANLLRAAEGPLQEQLAQAFGGLCPRLAPDGQDALRRGLVNALRKRGLVVREERGSLRYPAAGWKAFPDDALQQQRQEGRWMVVHVS